MNKNRKIVLLLLLPAAILMSSCGGYPSSNYVEMELPFEVEDCTSLILIDFAQSSKTSNMSSHVYRSEDIETIKECYDCVNISRHSPKPKKNLDLGKILTKTHIYSDFWFHLSDNTTYRFIATKSYVMDNDGSIYKFQGSHGSLYYSLFDPLSNLDGFICIDSWSNY
ncbi:MAG: hypothetical protein LUC16_01955 [Coprobacillus sp.]|nr:hypothetical protein [Coprobacillus sp.]